MGPEVPAVAARAKALVLRALAGPRSTFARFLLGTVVAVVCALAVVALALPGLAEHFLLAEKERELTLRGLRAEGVVRAFLEGGLGEDQAQAYLDVLAAEDSEVWVVNSDGYVVLESGIACQAVSGVPQYGMSPFPPGGPWVSPGGVPGRGGRWMRGSRLAFPDAARVSVGEGWSSTGEHWAYEVPVVSVSVPVTSADGSRVLGAVYLHSPVAGVSFTVGTLRRYLFLAAGVGLLAAFAVAWVLSRNVTRPVGLMTAMAKRIAEGDLDARVKGGLDELGELGRSLNIMAERLGEARDEGRRLEALRRELIADVSHDLRSPITTIRGFVEPLLDGTVADEPMRRSYLETIRRETDALGRLVADILELGRLEAGRSSLALTAVDIERLSRETVTRYRPGADEAGITLSADIRGPLPAVEGDEARIGRALGNLLDNALKFTPRGGRVTLTAEPVPGPGVALAVSDTGPGIPEGDLPYIWERFYKVDKSRRRRGESGGGPGSPSGDGVGLGLAIVKETVNAHGGRATVESRPGQGSTFRIILPAAEKGPAGPA
ncbi:MAG: sensor histidine kinase [Bacillota bacterium]|nr:MAG: sensor histidine kinase [Bacillota bacterium]